MYLKTPKQLCFTLLDLPGWAANVISLQVAGALLKLQLGGSISREYPNAPRDLSKAFTWTRRAAEKGHSNGLSNLAPMYGAGLGVRKDEAEALELLAKSVEAFPQLIWLLDKPDDWLKLDFKKSLGKNAQSS